MAEKQAEVTVPARVHDDLMIYLGHSLASGTDRESGATVSVIGGGFNVVFEVTLPTYPDRITVEVPLASLCAQAINEARRFVVDRQLEEIVEVVTR